MGYQKHGNEAMYQATQVGLNARVFIGPTFQRLKHLVDDKVLIVHVACCYACDSLWKDAHEMVVYAYWEKWARCLITR
jgi:hypothetical protein